MVIPVLIVLYGSLLIQALFVLCLICASLPPLIAAFPPHPPTKAGTHSLRINAPSEPYHHRPLLILPRSHRLGTENFTIHPPTPPLTLTPVRLDSGAFELRVEKGVQGGYAGGMDMGLLAACDGERGMSVKIVAAREQADAGDSGDMDGTDDTNDMGDTDDADQGDGADDGEGVDVENEERLAYVVDRWTGIDRGVLELVLEGEGQGWWEAVKWAPEGWGIVWTRTGERVHPVQMEVVAAKRRDGYDG